MVWKCSGIAMYKIAIWRGKMMIFPLILELWGCSEKLVPTPSKIAPVCHLQGNPIKYSWAYHILHISPEIIHELYSILVSPVKKLPASWRFFFMAPSLLRHPMDFPMDFPIGEIHTPSSQLPAIFPESPGNITLIFMMFHEWNSSPVSHNVQFHHIWKFQNFFRLKKSSILNRMFGFSIHPIPRILNTSQMVPKQCKSPKPWFLSGVSIGRMEKKNTFHYDLENNVWLLSYNLYIDYPLVICYVAIENGP